MNNLYGKYSYLIFNTTDINLREFFFLTHFWSLPLYVRTLFIFYGLPKPHSVLSQNLGKIVLFPPTPHVFMFFSRKFFPVTYDETLCKFLLCTYEDSHNSFWSKILSREHVEYVKVAWAENVDFHDCNFRVLRGIFLGVSIKQKLLKIEKYQGRWPF